MTQEVVVAIINGLCSLIGCVISNLTSHSKTIYRIEQLEQKQDKHNSLIERMYNVEKEIDIIKEKQEYEEKRVDEIIKNC